MRRDSRTWLSLSLLLLLSNHDGIVVLSSSSEQQQQQQQRSMNQLWDNKLARYIEVPASTTANKNGVAKASDHTMVAGAGGSGYATTTAATAGTKKYLILHIGPARTASTMIQREIVRIQDSYLKQDGYVYIGEDQIQTNKVMGSLHDGECMKQVTNAGPGGSLPSCWTDKMLVGLRELKSTNANVLMSTESMNIPEWTTTATWWDIFNTAVKSEANLQLVVVGVYRRLFEWLPSIHNQRNERLIGGKWPRNGGKYPKPMYPQIWESYYVTRYGQHGSGHLWYYWISDYIETLAGTKTNVELRILNLHKQFWRTIESKFFCDMLPNAVNSCRYAKQQGQRRKLGQSTGTTHRDLLDDEIQTARVFGASLNYDYLARAAAKYDLVDSSRYTRDNVAESIRQYQEMTLNRGGNGYPVNCPPRGQSARMMNASWTWEFSLLPEMATNETYGDHRRKYWQVNDDFKYCTIDTNTTLQLPEWIDFFKKYLN